MSYKLKNDTVKKISNELNLRGNIIPHSWYQHLRYEKSGRPHLPAIIILSDIIYWYRPVEKRDEASNRLIEIEQKFKADKLQKQYKDYVDFFGFGKSQTKNAIDYLVDKKLITREFRNIYAMGQTLSNVMFLEPVVENIKKITYLDIENKGYQHRSEEGINTSSDTYTKSTTNISTKINKTDKGNPETVADKENYISLEYGLNNLIDNPVPLSKFSYLYLQHTGEDHQPVKQEVFYTADAMMQRIVNESGIEYFRKGLNKYFNDAKVDRPRLDYFIKVATRYFDTQFYDLI